jgi:hypothetical protein
MKHDLAFLILVVCPQGGQQLRFVVPNNSSLISSQEGKISWLLRILVQVMKTVANENRIKAPFCTD